MNNLLIDYLNDFTAAVLDKVDQSNPGGLGEAVEDLHTAIDEQDRILKEITE